MTSTGDTCLVHLVWGPLGPEPLERFLDSYRRHEAGVSHRLLMLFNGFASGADLGPWRRALAGMEYEELRLARPVLDLAAYWQALERVPAERYCFLNSYAVVLADNWLGALWDALQASDVGIAGASGSWGSVRSFQRFMLGLGGRYARVFEDRRAAVSTLAGLGGEDRRTEEDDDRSAEAPNKRAPLKFARALLEQSYGFTPFPAAHVRTNCFMANREVLLKVEMRRLARKADAYRFESGRHGLTAQIERMGLAARLVGRDGRSYPASDWPESRTFWQADQENLLVSDNQTRAYEHGDVAVRAALSRYAWGEAADWLPAARASLK